MRKNINNKPGRGISHDCFLLYAQCSSSLSSSQSFPKSHTQSGGTHEPREQVNSRSEALINAGVNSRAKASRSCSDPFSDAIGLVSGPPLTILPSPHLQSKHFVATAEELQSKLSDPHSIPEFRIQSEH